MKYLVIGNKGKMDAALSEISLMGASTKRNDSKKIGQFGTGNKYAIAYLLRNNFNVTIHSGTNRVLIKTETVQLKENKFEVVLFNGIRTGYTTELGYKWTLWQAIRELYSNAIDEGLLSFGIDEWDEELHLLEDSTFFFIEADDRIMDFWYNRHNYFILDEKPIWRCEFGEIYEKRGKDVRVFNNGIKCYDSLNESLFDYNFFDVQLSEGRLAKYDFEIHEKVHRILAYCDDPVIVRAILNNNANNFEANMDSVYDRMTYSNTWKEEIKKGQVFSKSFAGWLSESEVMKTFLVPSKMYQMLIAQFGNEVKPKSLQYSDTGVPYREVKINDTRAGIISKAMDFFHDAGFQFDYKIKVVDFREKDTMGSIDKENSLVLLSIKAIDQGTDYVLNTCIEEYIHLKWGVADETRGFQDAVITELINYMKGVIK